MAKIEDIIQEGSLDFSLKDNWLEPEGDLKFGTPMPFSKESLEPGQALPYQKELARAFINGAWNEYLYLFDFIDSVDYTSGGVSHVGSWILTAVGGGAFSTISVGRNIQTGTTSGNNLRITKAHGSVALRMNKLQMFRGSFTFGAITSQTAYFVRGEAQATTGDKYYGFKVIDGTLYGVASTNGTDNESTIQLKTFSVGAGNFPLEIMAIYEPGKVVKFYEYDFTSTTIQGLWKLLGTLSSSLPIPSGNFDYTPLGSAKITTNTSAARDMSVFYFEYLQQR